MIDPSTRRLGPDIAPGLFAFVPLDRRRFITPTTALILFKEQRVNVDMEIAMRKLAFKAAQPPKPKPPPPRPPRPPPPPPGP
jgi:hypothetical protein